MRHLQTHLSRIFGGCGKAKAQPSQYLIEWSDGSRSVLAKNGRWSQGPLGTGWWWYRAPDGCKYGHHYLHHAKAEVESLGGKIIGRTNYSKGDTK